MRTAWLKKMAQPYLEYLVHVISYFYFVTDDRPGIFSEKVEIYKKK